MPATIDDVARMAMALPEVTEGTSYGHRTWFVRKKHFVWERPFSKADLRRFGDREPPDGLIVAALVDDLEEKEVVLASAPCTFTIPHFDGYPAVLIHMRAAGRRVLKELVLDAWLAGAPDALARTHLDPGGRR